MNDLEEKDADNQQVKKEKRDDLQVFIDYYQPSKYKVLKNGVEVRSVTDVEGSSLKASNLIKSMQLGLVVVRDAELAQRGCFEVREVEVKKQCGQFPFFGASYPDATCIDGLLWDLDSYEDGGLTSGGEHPCPFCNPDGYAQDMRDNDEDEADIQAHLKFINERYKS